MFIPSKSEKKSGFVTLLKRVAAPFEDGRPKVMGQTRITELLASTRIWSQLASLKSLAVSRKYPSASLLKQLRGWRSTTHVEVEVHSSRPQIHHDIMRLVSYKFTEASTTATTAQFCPANRRKWLRSYPKTMFARSVIGLLEYMQQA